jgi:recombination protein RecR
MIDQNPSLMLLLKQLQRVPYLASKNLYLVAHYFLDMSEQDAEYFCKTIMSVKHNIEKCAICWTWKEKSKDCFFCTCKKRDKATICVVETWRDLIAIEKTGGYTGLYHVLGGALCPLNGVGPDDLTVKQLLERIDTECNEIIFAFNQTLEGEATAAFIASKLKGKSITLSCIARGLPVGSSLEGMDYLTVKKAICERRTY